ncbi:MAG TPA: nucleotidyltransferase domain-containing protein [Gemmatimonadaceae bacterium]
MARMTLDDLVAQLTKAFGSGLRSVVLYGSAAAGEHIPNRSDYNVLVIADGLDLETLRRGAAVSRAWAEVGNAAPLILTTHEWHSSADVFAMEYADILERHRVLYGAAPFDGIAVDKHDLRMELEHQAKGKVLQLRRAILASHGEAKRHIELLSSSLSTFMVIFRALLRLYDEIPPADNEALITQVAARTGIGLEAFVRVVHHVRGATTLSERDVNEVLSGYLAGAEQIASFVDRMDAE